MASIKVKFRPSSVNNREGTIYYQVIHERVIRQIRTEYRGIQGGMEHEGGCHQAPATGKSKKLPASCRSGHPYGCGAHAEDHFRFSYR